MGGDSILDSKEHIFAEFNPGSPVIAMPKDDFEKVKEKFIEGLKSDKYFCSNDYCARLGKCESGPMPTL
jgi:hypothetical protein